MKDLFKMYKYAEEEIVLPTTDPSQDPNTSVIGTKWEIPDITEIEEMGRPSRIYPTPSGAKYEDQSKIDGKYAKHPLIIRRIHHLEKNEPKVILQIQSPQLVKFLRQLPHSALMLETHEYPILVPEPYKAIFHLSREIHQAALDSRCPDLKKAFSYLLQFQKERMNTIFCEIDALMSVGRITFHYLWALYKPGELIALFRLDDAGQPNIWFANIKRFHYVKEDHEKGWKIEVLSSEIRGDRVGQVLSVYEFPAFLGIWQIAELPVIPLCYLPNREELKAKAISRGKLYKDLARPPGVTPPGGVRGTIAPHRLYLGPFWVRKKEPSNEISMRYIPIYRKGKDQDGCRFFDSAAYHVSPLPF
jgi:hypothetical protein